MDERTGIAPKFNKMLKGYGYNPVTTKDGRKCPHCHKMVYPAVGWPDVLVLHPRSGAIYVEYKMLRLSDTNKSFSFSEIGEKQRKKMAKLTEDGYRCYLGLGVVQVADSYGPRPVSMRDQILALYLVDWSVWLKLEAKITPIQNSIPYDLDLMGRVAQGLRPDKEIVTMLWHWCLVREGKQWKLPEKHTALPAGHHSRFLLMDFSAAEENPEGESE